jgi:integrase/recombinase XerD
MRPTPPDELPLRAAVAEYLADLAQANRSIHTVRAYRLDLQKLAAFYDGGLTGVTADILRAFFATCAHLSPATRARTEASVASFLDWAYRHDRIAADPMQKLDRVKLPPPAPRGVRREEVEAVLTQIPKQHRDHLLVRLVFELGLRIGEALTLHVEDLDLTKDDEHVQVTGKAGRRRTLLLDDPGLVREIRGYLRRTGYRHGLLFRAEKNGTGGPLRYQSVHERWAGYCARGGVTFSLHRMRHGHGAELVNDGVSLATIRKRLGHASIQTTLRYAEQADATSDAELRARRRQKLRP